MAKAREQQKPLPEDALCSRPRRRPGQSGPESQLAWKGQRKRGSECGPTRLGKPNAEQPRKGEERREGRGQRSRETQQASKGKPAEAGKLSKGKPAPLQPKSRRARREAARGKKRNHRGGRSEQASQSPIERGQTRRELAGTDAVVLRENPDAPPEPKTPAEEASADESEEPKNPSSESSLEVHPAPFFTGPAPGENPDFGREHVEAERDQPPASSKAAPAAKEETAEREEPPASKSAAPKAAEEAEAKPKTSAKAAAGNRGGRSKAEELSRGCAEGSPGQARKLFRQQAVSHSKGTPKARQTQRGKRPAGLREAVRHRPWQPWEGNPDLAGQYGETLDLLE